MTKLVLESNFTQRHVAEIFNVKPAFVKRLIKNEVTRTRSVEQLALKQVEEEARRRIIRESVQ